MPVSDAERKSHPYNSERVTPISEIPPENQDVANLPAGGSQVVDNRLCYNWQPDPKPHGRFVECGSVQSDAEKFLNGRSNSALRNFSQY